MRQTMSEFSLDSLSSMLDDELSLEPEVPPAAEAVAPALVPPTQLPPAMQSATIPVGTMPVMQSSGPAPTEFVSNPLARLSALTQPNANVRKSSLEETQLYKSTPQPTIDLSIVRRSASEPTQAFTGQLADHVDVSATIPALVDPKKSSVPETTFWSPADREAMDLASVTQPVPLSLGEVVASVLVPGVTSVAPPEAVAPSETTNPSQPDVTQPLANVAPESDPITAQPIAPQLAAFFDGEPRRTTDARWEQAVESDRQFTTMLLSDMDELPWRSEPQKLTPEIVPAASAVVEEPPLIADASAAAPPATPVLAEALALDPAAFDVLEVVGAEQASFAATLAPQLLPASQEAPAESIPVPKPKFPEPTDEVRELAAFVLGRFTPGVSTVVALVGCEATRPGAEASIALAAAIADATGISTMIVDGDFANREISSAYDFAAAPGFAEALGQPAKGRVLAQSIGRENLYLLPAGDAVPEASEAPGCVSAWIAKAKQEYGLILVWLGAGEGEVARRLCGAADASLLLAAVDRDRPSRIEIAAERLRSSNARALGVALVR